MFNISRKTEEVAETPIKINLQLFAEDEPAEIDTPVDSSEDIEPVEEQAEEPEVAEPEPQVQSHEANRAFQEMRKRVDASENFARSLGYNSFEELQIAQQQQNYVNAGYDPAAAQLKAQFDILQSQVWEQNNRARIVEEKSKLQSEKYFKDLEPDIDKLLGVNPALSVEGCFKYLKGEKLNDLLAKETAATKQKTINNINSKSHLKTEGDGGKGDIGDIDINADTLQMYMDSGMTKAQAIAYHKKLYGK